MTIKIGKPRVRSGRIPKCLKLPFGVHQQIKELAEERNETISDLYDRIVRDFLEKAKNSSEDVGYLSHRSGNVENISIYLAEKNANDIKKVAAKEFVSENRVLFTAIMHFHKKNI